MGILLFLKSNYKIIGLILALLGSFYSGYHYANLQWENKYQKDQIEQMAKAEDMTKKLQSIANQIEKQSYEVNKKHDKELVYYRNIISNSHGVFGNTTHEGTATGSAGSSKTGTGGERLSKESVQFLFGEANKADRVVDQLLQCQKYVNSITQQSNGGK